ncbi:MAG: EAL domain-containing protein [Ilumatobacter sp.]
MGESGRATKRRVDALGGVFRDDAHIAEVAAAASRRVGFVVQSTDGTIVGAGSGADDTLCGWSPSALLSQDGSALVHPDDVARSIDARHAVLDGASSELVQVRASRDGGAWVWTELEHRRFRPADADLGPHTVAYLRDVSEAHVDHDALALLTEVRSATEAAPTLDDAWHLGLERIGQLGGFLGGVVWQRRDHVWSVRHAWSADVAREDLAAVVAGRGDLPQAPVTVPLDGSVGAAVWARTHSAIRLLIGHHASHHRLASLSIPVERNVADAGIVVELVSGRGRCENEALVIGVARQLGDAIGHREIKARLSSAERDVWTAFADAPVGAAVVRPDGTLEHANAALAAFLGRTRDELVESSFEAITHPDDRDLGIRGRRALLDGVVEGSDADRRCLFVDGSERWARITIKPERDERGTIVKFIALVRDIDARKRAEFDAQAARARLRATFDESGVAMALVQTDGERPGVLCETNHAFLRLTGIEADGVACVDDVIVGDFTGQFLEGVELLAAPGAEVFHAEIQVHGRSAGDERWVRIVAAPVREAELAGSFAVVHFEDITEQRQAQQDLARMALHDSLTGLPNRALILDRICNAQDRTERSGRHLGMLFLDLDNFKDVNDSLGHEHGDLLLVAIAERLQATIRPADTAARLGGDEFLILCDELSNDPIEAASELESVASRIHLALHDPIRLGEIDAYCTTSIGMEVVSGTAIPVETALGNADAARYRAKSRGRARTEAYGATTRRTTIDRLRMASELRHAVNRDELRVAYQPIVDVASGAAVGAEALLRWTHPVLGEVPPVQFIDVAEDSDLIVGLGEFVLERVCSDISQRHHDEDFYVSVNVSARQLSRYNFVEAYRDQLARFDLDPGRIALELTENVLMDAAGSSLDQLGELRAMGAHIGVDDFGTGYASLTYLKQLPISFVKIDRSFIDGLAHDRDDRSITDAVISLARALDLRVIAEGVETAEQASILDELNCGFAQGFHFGRPVVEAA